MTTHTSKRGGLRFVLPLTIAMVLSAFVAVSSASAASEHWYAAPQTSVTGSQSYAGKALGALNLSFKIAGGRVNITCETLANPGSVENPANGAVGTLSSESYALEGCTPNLPSCQIKEERILFESLKASVFEEAGEEVLQYSPKAGGGALAVMHFLGAECFLGTSLLMSGSFAATPAPERNDAFVMNPSKSHVTIGEQSVKMEGGFGLYTPEGEGLTLASTGSPGVPHWYRSGGQWTALSESVPTSYASTGSLSFGMSVKIAGGKTEIVCSGSGNSISGSLLNPGGVGTATAGITLGQCSPFNVPGCTLQLPAHSAALSGVATEVGGSPVVEFTPSEGTTVISFNLNPGCTLGNVITVTGKLLAKSDPFGNFSLATSELHVGEQNAVTSGGFVLQTTGGEAVRLMH